MSSSQISVEVPTELLEEAMKVTGKDASETIAEGLERIRRRGEVLKALQGSMHLDINIDELRGRNRS